MVEGAVDEIRFALAEPDPYRREVLLTTSSRAQTTHSFPGAPQGRRIHRSHSIGFLSSRKCSKETRPDSTRL